MKDASLTRHAEREAHLQQEAKEARAGLKQGHASWRKMRKELSEQLFQSEMAREALFKQLAETGRKLTFHSAQVEGKREAMMGELEKCRSEVHHLEGVVKAELAERKGVELEMERWKLEVEKAGRRCREAEGRQAEAEKRWGEERARKEASEREGESLRQEVGRLSEELRVCQRQLQAEKEGKVEKEKVMEESLAHLQQELAKRAQQVSWGASNLLSLEPSVEREIFLSFPPYLPRFLKWTDCCRAIKQRPRPVDSNWSAP